MYNFEQSYNISSPIKKFWNILKKTIVAILLLFIILVVLFSIPWVQTTVAKKLANSINDTYNTNIQIDKVSITYFGDVKLEKAFVEDHHQDTLIYVNELKTSILSLSGLLDNHSTLGNSSIDSLTFRMKRYKGEELDNFAVFLQKFEPEQPKPSSDFHLSVSHIDVTNSKYSFEDENISDPRALFLNDVDINADNLVVNNKNVSVSINTLDFLEERGLTIKNLNGDFTYSPTQMGFEELRIVTEDSDIKGTLYFNYTIEDLSDFVNKVKWDFTLEESVINTNDLKPFYNEFGNNVQFVMASNMQGTLNDFELTNLELQGMNRSEIYGEIRIRDAVTNPEDLIINGTLSNLSTNYYDLVSLLPNILRPNLPESLKELGNVRLTGTARVTPTTVTTKADLFSQLGTAKVDIDLARLNDSENATYKGNLNFKDFNVGRLAKTTNLGTTTFNLDVDGKGFTTESLNTNVKGTITKLKFNNYTYKNIKVLGTLRNPVFNGNLLIDDPNLQMEFNGLADVSKDINIYDFEASVRNADLNALNFVGRDSISNFQGDVFMRMKGTTINDAFGTISLSNATYENQNDIYAFEDLRIQSSFDNGVRTIDINSPDVINGKVVGVFAVEEVPALFENAVGSLYTNYTPNTITTNQFLEFDFDIYNKIVEVFYPEINFGPETFIRGRVESDESEFKLTFRSPLIEAFGNRVEKVNIQVDNKNPLFNTYVEADSISTNYYNVSEFNLINVTLKDTLFIRSEIVGGKSNDDAFNLNLYHTINENGNSVVGIQKSDVKFKEKVWYLNAQENKSNKIIFENNFKDLKIDSLVLSHQSEEIRLAGQMRDSTYKDFNIAFKDVDLGKITPDIDSLALAGNVNGTLNFKEEDGAYYPKSELTIDALSINKGKLGDLSIDIDGNEDLSQYAINALLRDDGFDSFSAVGTIDVVGEEPTINMDVEMKQLDISVFSPLGGIVISDLRGIADGRAKVTGNYKNPDIDGKIILDKGGLLVPYLNTDFDFKEKAIITLTKQQFKFNQVKIEDTEYKTQGQLNGIISHKSFSDWYLDLGIRGNQLLVLNTDYQEDALYYGTAFIDGEATIVGPTDELVIDVIAETEPGTIFKIPLSDTESIGDNSFIHFLSPEEKEARLAGEEVIFEEVKGLSINFDLDIDKDAEVEIVVDQVSGSTLKGKGAGTLLIEIDTNGKFNMWGDFVAYEGVYNFKYGGLVQKQFEVVSGGSINWDGSPIRAQLDVQAVYKVQANPSIILENPSINRKIPVEVVISLNGEIVQPDISFDINYPNVSSVVRSELDYLIDDRASRELQALSLVTQGTFYSEFALGNNIVSGTLAERASSLVNDAFSDENGKFQVGLNYTTGDRTPDQETADRFGLTITTQISNRVLINGQVGVPIGGVSESVVVGDVEIEFLLNEEGTLRASIFNRENNIQYIGEELGYTQGAGLSYNVDFNTFKELIDKITNRQVRIDADIQTEKQPETLAPDYIKFPGGDGGN